MTDAPEFLRQLVHAAEAVVPEEMTMFLPPDDGSGRASAVLIVLCETTDGPSILLIQRAADMRRHAGQVAFPGGAVDASDVDHVAAALREAQEEVGLNPASVQTLGELPAIFIPPSGFVVTPVLAWWPHPHPVAPGDPAEVARVEIVPIAELADPANRFRVPHPSGWFGPGFEVRDLYVWGFTAMLLDRILEMGGWGRPWDNGQQRPLPAANSGRPTVG
ncbi:MAG: CoA pyrophosphatase [Jatrophihabitantaceae bacterium]